MNVVVINVTIYVVLMVLGTVSFRDYQQVTALVSLPAMFSMAIDCPWTFITYMWIHYSLWHLVFNMLWLMWMGSMLLRVVTPRQFVMLYFAGGISGAILYVAVSSLLSADMGQLPLVGASAAIMAIIVATALLQPDFRVNVPILGLVPLKWIAFVALILGAADFISQASGSNFAHLGGAIAGIIYVAIRRIKFRRRVVSDSTSDIEKILLKIKQSGYSALSDNEKRQLFNAKK